KQLHASLMKVGLNKVLIPYSPISNDEYDASGIYINYLQVGKTVIYPEYGIKEDSLAHKVFSRYFGNNAISIRANAIAKKGGVLNCISWNIIKGGNDGI
ncbi:MAG: agmatine deiminase family protein, partial [Candidatus Omnitrophota bacterium]